MKISFRPPSTNCGLYETRPDAVPVRGWMRTPGDAVLSLERSARWSVTGQRTLASPLEQERFRVEKANREPSGDIAWAYQLMPREAARDVICALLDSCAKTKVVSRSSARTSPSSLMPRTWYPRFQPGQVLARSSRWRRSSLDGSTMERSSSVPPRSTSHATALPPAEMATEVTLPPPVPATITGSSRSRPSWKMDSSPEESVPSSRATGPRPTA